MSWQEFPALSPDTLRAIKKAIDHGFLNYSRSSGEMWEQFFFPLKQFLIASEHAFVGMPWPLMVGLLAALAWWSTRRSSVVIMAVLSLLAIGLFDMWEDTMKTFSMILVATVVCLVIGLPIGVALSRFPALRRVAMPVMDAMQTMPSFVYLIPVVMLLGIGKVPGLIAVVIYAIAPIIRLTHLGIEWVDESLLEAADAFGATRWQKLIRVQLPLALPSIMAGVNQSIMLALSMVVVAAMIGVQGLGQPVLKAISNQYFTLGVFNGLAIVAIAMILDRISQGFGKRLQAQEGPKS
jgi:glycine betaine/proline transport system permease protein